MDKNTIVFKNSPEVKDLKPITRINESTTKKETNLENVNFYFIAKAIVFIGLLIIGLALFIVVNLYNLDWFLPTLLYILSCFVSKRLFFDR